MPAGPSIIYRFETFELDPGRFELRHGGQAIAVEPQVLSLLILLVANAERLVSKDEVAEKIWNNPGTSDATIASRVKSARRALGDDGDQQRLIRTVHGRGFRFVGSVGYAGAPEPAATAAAGRPEPATDDRPSIAVLPFRVVGEAGPLDVVADALADELITDLARLRWLLVIARTSTFRFRGKDTDCGEIGAAFNVRYCLTGTLRSRADRVTLSVELARTRDSAVVWAEQFTAGLDELPLLQQEILASLVAKLEVRIVQQEVDLARRVPLSGLDAWSSYHLGLDHMFRFNQADNGHAAALFERALALNQNFSRALSGLSFTCFQDSFLQYSGSGEDMARRARALAEQALACDPLDPFAHLNLGRSLWFEKAVPESLERLAQCIALSPNYAQAIYSRAWAEMTQGDAANSDAHAALALRLSPLDPLRYAMLAVRSVSALFQGDSGTAADLGETAARSPGAHKHIAVIAAITTHADGRSAQAAQWLARARQMDAGVTPASFFRSFPFAPSEGRERIERSFRELGFRAPA
ncbi:MAG: winged helix-turn-helix domain-containing protein [Arenimonas sp.]|nr:winged helix-turn-helix domain-containing protein [Arenimonas sp.]